MCAFLGHLKIQSELGILWNDWRGLNFLNSAPWNKNLPFHNGLHHSPGLLTCSNTGRGATDLNAIIYQKISFPRLTANQNKTLQLCFWKRSISKNWKKILKIWGKMRIRKKGHHKTQATFPKSPSFLIVPQLYSFLPLSRKMNYCSTFSFPLNIFSTVRKMMREVLGT